MTATLERAIALDDPAPDDVCPGCGHDITGWRTRQFHVPTRNGVRFVTDSSFGRACPWSRDYLTARAFRRRYIAEHQAT